MSENKKFLNRLLPNNPDNPSLKEAPVLTYRNNLPHFQPLCATFFITFRLKGSIPIAVLNQLRVQKEQLLKAASDNEAEKYKAHKRIFKLTDDYLEAPTYNTGI